MGWQPPCASVCDLLTIQRQLWRVSSDLRLRIPGARVFFTVALADRRSGLPVRQAGVLREAVPEVRAERGIETDAFVVLPDDLQCVWALPEEDADYSPRWKAIKTNFTKSVGLVGRREIPPESKGLRK